METRHKPILKYLITKNHANSGSKQFQEQDIVNRLARMLINAQIVISRAYRKWYLRRSKANNIFDADIHIDENLNYDNEVYLIGAFTPNPWKDKLKMKYSYLHRSYCVRARLKEGSKFTFLVNGAYKISGQYEFVTGIFDEKFNIFSLNKSNNFNTLYQLLIVKSLTMKEKNYQKFDKLVNGLANQIKSYKQSKASAKMQSISKILTAIPSTCIHPKVANSKKHINSKVYAKKVQKIQDASKIKPKDQPKFNSDKKRPKVQFENSYNPFVSDLVTCSISNTEDVFDEDFFGKKDESPKLKKKLSMSTYKKELRILIRESKTKQQMNHKLNKWYSSETFSEDDVFRELNFVASGHLIAKGKQSNWEDAFFVHKQAIGIADGVGGWSRFGINCSEFSNDLMNKWLLFCQKFIKMQKFTLNLFKVGDFMSNFDRYCDSISSQVKSRRLHSNSFSLNQQGGESPLSSSKNIHENVSEISKDKLPPKTKRVDEAFILDPLTILKEAYKNISSYGSSTAWVWTIQNRSIKVANLGDSGLILLRYNQDLGKSKVILWTKDQQHDFNTPFQLANIPKRARSKNHKEDEQQFWEDQPNAAEIYTSKVKSWDIVILGTDGLFDNLFLDDILEIINEFMKHLYVAEDLNLKHFNSGSPSTDASNYSINFTQDHSLTLAKRLAKAAKTRSKCQKTMSPFEQKWNKFIMQKKSKNRTSSDELLWTGGKRDDIGVVVAFIS